METQTVLDAARATFAGSLPFPRIVESLLATGVEYYHVDYVSLRITLHDGQGSVVTVPIAYEDIPPVAADFDHAALRAAILDSQQHGQPYRAFSQRAARAGVQAYYAFLRGKRVTYLGRQGEQHTEWFRGCGTEVDVTMTTLLQLVATLCCALFAGAATYVNLVEHPARMSCGIELAATEWAPSYQRGARMQAPLAVIGFLSALGAWLAGASDWFLVGGVLLGLAVPFTLVVVKPVNDRLLSPTLDRRSDETRTLLQRWNALHAVRTALSLLGLLVLLLAR